MQDAIGLAESLKSHDDLQGALKHYEEKRRAEIMDLQSAAVSSTEWFEDVPSYIDQPITQFAYSLWKRRGHHPWWRYHLHLATQISPLRRLRQALSAARNGRRAMHRMKIVGISPPAHPDAEVPSGSVRVSEQGPLDVSATG
jgi:2-polyprenyl-6-methoxyphenol hydroxylase-like FAD-dependent oxidoreductase